MKRKTTYLAALSLALVISTSLGTAWSYFTTNDSASGGFRLNLGSETRITETFDSWTKHVTVTNDADSQQSVYVRARAFAGMQYTLTGSGAGWRDGGDGYFYYDGTEEDHGILDPGKKTAPLDIVIDGVPSPEPSVGREFDPDSFNVAVVYESTPVQYDENGKPYPDWNFAQPAAEGGAEG